MKKSKKWDFTLRSNVWESFVENNVNNYKQKSHNWHAGIKNSLNKLIRLLSYYSERKGCDCADRRDKAESLSDQT